MRWLVIAVAGFAATGVAAAQPAGHAKERGRQVELITMMARPDGAVEPLRRVELQDDLPAPSAPEAFRVHDLSRRWVEFQMASSFTKETAPIGPTGAPLETDQASVVAPLSSIAVPAWMRGAPAYSVAAAPYTPGCGAAAYRVTGFLRPDAEARRASYFGTMAQIACEYGIPVGLFDAMIIQESRYQPNIFSPKNAFGLTQLMPGTAAALGVNRYHPEDNLRGGAKYLRQHLDRFGYPHLALAAYNAGPGRVRGGLVPQIAETKGYVDNVLSIWSRVAGSSRRAVILEGNAQRPAPAPVPMGRRAVISTY